MEWCETVGTLNVSKVPHKGNEIYLNYANNTSDFLRNIFEKKDDLSQRIFRQRKKQANPKICLLSNEINMQKTILSI